LGATGAQNLGFPIDFDSRPYNSVTHTVLHCDGIIIYTVGHKKRGTLFLSISSPLLIDF